MDFMVCNLDLSKVGIEKSHSFITWPLYESKRGTTEFYASDSQTRQNQGDGGWAFFWISGPPSQLTLVLGRIQCPVVE